MHIAQPNKISPQTHKFAKYHLKKELEDIVKKTSARVEKDPSTKEAEVNGDLLGKDLLDIDPDDHKVSYFIDLYYFIFLSNTCLSFFSRGIGQL